MTCGTLSDGEAVLYLPFEGLYWAVLDVGAIPQSRSVLGRARRLRRKSRAWTSSSVPGVIEFLLERELPELIEEVHAVYCPVGDNRVLACAIPREVLVGLVGEHPTAVVAVPRELPPSIIDGCKTSDGESEGTVSGDAVASGADRPSPAVFNLLTGAFMPASVRRLRARRSWCAFVATILAACVFAIGAQRRIDKAHRERADIDRTITAAARDALGESGSASEGEFTAPPEVRLLAERRRLERTRRPFTAHRRHALRDAGDTLARLLAQWPSEGPATHVETESLEVTEESISLRIGLASGEAVESLVASLIGWDDWVREQPELATPDGRTTLTLRYTRQSLDSGGDP